MLAARHTLLGELEAAYERDGDTDFAAFVRARRVESDDALADLIDLDGRLRISRRISTDLSRYLDAIPQLSSLPVALDAAIEFTLRSNSVGGKPSEEAVRTLVQRYPNLERPIREAAALSRGLLTTDRFVATAATPGTEVRLPADYGPKLPDGRPRYELRQRLGVGSQGVVYLAADRYLSEADRPAWVAIKVLVDATASRTMRQRVVDEATKARRVTHANVVRVLDRGVDESGREFIVNEYIDGGDLAGAVNAGRVRRDPKQVVRLMVSVAHGVQAAHAAGLVHCDLKPANILLTAAGVPKVGDFGIAARAGSIGFGAGGERALGNLAFIAPEQYRGDEGAAAAPADIFALGGILYYLLTGALPNGANVEEIAAVHAATGGRATAPSLRALLPGIDPDLDAICGRALAPNRADRYASADALASDLEAWLRHEPLYWAKSSAARRLSLLARRQPAILAVAVGSALLLAAAAAGVVWLNMSARERIIIADADARTAEAIAGVEKQKTDNTIRFTQIWLDADRVHGKLSAEWLPLLTILESFFGPAVLQAGPPGSTPAWRKRIQTVERLISDAEARGQGTSLQTLLWKQLRAFWLLRDGDAEGARIALEQLRPEWARIARADDEFLVLHDAMLAGTDVLRAEGAALKPGEGGPIEPAKLHGLEQQLLRAHAMVKRIGYNEAYFRLFSEHLSRLYAPALLNKPEESARFKKLAAAPREDADDPYAPAPDAAATPGQP